MFGHTDSLVEKSGRCRNYFEEKQTIKALPEEDADGEARSAFFPGGKQKARTLRFGPVSRAGPP